MDKQILNAIAEVLKDERKRSSIEIGELADSIPNYDQQLDEIEKALSEFSEFTAVKKEHDSFLAAEIERIHATINTKAESDSSIVSDLKKWASDFELKKEFEYIQFQEEFSELKEIALSVKDGENGEDGKDGADGVDGRDGVDNPAIAPIHIDRNFKANKGLVVHHRGGLWQAIRNTNGDPEVDSGNWNCFVDGVTNVSSSFDPESALHSLHFEKTNGEKETISFERPPAYLPAGEHKSIDGDYFFDGTGLNVYVKGSWLGIDLKGEKGESGGRGRKGQIGVGVDDIIPTQDGFTFLMTDGQTKDVSFPQEIKDLIVDLIGTYAEEVDQEIRRYAGTWHSSKSYSSGDVVTLTSALFLCLNNTSDSPESGGGNWVQMTSQSGGGAYLSSDGNSGIGAVPDFVLTTEGGAGGTHLSEFKESSSTLIKFVGVDENNRDVKATITTDMVQTNPLPFRNSKNGQFIGTPEELEQLTDQRKVNEFFYKTLGDIEAGDVDLDGYATQAELEEVDRTSQMRDEILDEKIEAWDVSNTAVHLRLEQQIIRVDSYSTEGDEKLQAQIDNIADALPEDPNNSRAINIGEQVVKITGSRPVGADGEDGKILIWKAERGGPADPFNECKLVVPNVDVIDLEASAIWFKQGDKVQQWYVPDSGWLTNTNVLHYSATSSFGDALVDGQPVELWYEDPNKAPAEYYEVISKAESKADDRHLQSEIDQIALALETLLVQRDHGQWKYVGFSGDTIPRNAGEFALAVDDLSASDNIITLNQEDIKGTTHGFGDVEVGDYVEIVDVDAPESYALYVVTKAPDGSGIVNVEVSLKDGGLNIWIGETCEIRFFQVNEQDLQLEDLDQRYLRLTGGEMASTATLKVNVLEPVNTPMIQYNGDPTSTHAAGLINRYMMTEHTKQYLKLSGGQMSGGINMGTTPIMAVQYLGMTGAKAIQEGQTTRIKFENKVVIERTGDNKDGFVIKGKDNSNLLSAYHNSTDLDSINYTGKTGGSTNIATCGYVDSRVDAAKGALLSHKERLYHKANQTDGKSFYFHNQYGAPATGMNDFRKFKWKLPSNHYLDAMSGAGINMGYLVICNTSGQLLYQCQVNNALKDGLYITLDLDHDSHYGTSILGDASWYVVELYSCLREGQ